MRLVALFAFCIMLVFAVASFTHASVSSGCRVGSALGFVAMNPQPFLIGTLPPSYTNDQRFFSSRYNCKGKGAQARRVDLGTYQVQFPQVQGHTAVVTALSSEGIASSVYMIDANTFRITLRGPNDLLRDVAFSIVVY